jgi:NADH-quinone oxidoreductase subunit N
MYFREGGSGQTLNLSSGFKFTLAGLAAVTILLGIFPNLLTYWLYF